MSSATQYLQKKLLDHALGKASFTMPTVYLALFTSDPSEMGSLAGEVSGGSYVRVEATSKMAATVLATGIAANSTAVTFAAPTADWGIVSHWALCDASSAGNALFYGPLATSELVSNGSAAPTFPAGFVQISGLSAASPYATQ